MKQKINKQVANDLLLKGACCENACVFERLTAVKYPHKINFNSVHVQRTSVSTYTWSKAIFSSPARERPIFSGEKRRKIPRDTRFSENSPVRLSRSGKWDFPNGPPSSSGNFLSIFISSTFKVFKARDVTSTL